VRSRYSKTSPEPSHSEPRSALILGESKLYTQPSGHTLGLPLDKRSHQRARNWSISSVTSSTQGSPRAREENGPPRGNTETEETETEPAGSKGAGGRGAAASTKLTEAQIDDRLIEAETGVGIRGSILNMLPPILGSVPPSSSPSPRLPTLPIVGHNHSIVLPPLAQTPIAKSPSPPRTESTASSPSGIAQQSRLTKESFAPLPSGRASPKLEDENLSDSPTPLSSGRASPALAEPRRLNTEVSSRSLQPLEGADGPGGKKKKKRQWRGRIGRR